MSWLGLAVAVLGLLAANPAAVNIESALAATHASAEADLQARQDSLFVDEREAMGTTARITIYAANSLVAEARFESAFEELERIEQALSTYRSTSEVSRINREAGLGWVVTDPEVFGLLYRSVALSRETNGAFDVSVGALMDVWGFGAAGPVPPGNDALVRALSLSGHEQVELDPDARRVRFRSAGLQLDFGSNGKGYALDRVAEVLRSVGSTRALLSMGGSTYLAMEPPIGRSGWAVELSDPGDDSVALGRTLLVNESLSTSGSTRRFIEVNGRRYGHILDARTGHPVVGVWQVSVVASGAEQSDAMSTACYVMGYDQCLGHLGGPEVARVAWIAPVSGAPTIRVSGGDWFRREPGIQTTYIIER